MDAETRARKPISEYVSERVFEGVRPIPPERLKKLIASALHEAEAAAYNQAIEDAAEKLESVSKSLVRMTGDHRMAYRWAAQDIRALKKEPE